MTSTKASSSHYVFNQRFLKIKLFLSQKGASIAHLLPKVLELLESIKDPPNQEEINKYIACLRLMMFVVSTELKLVFKPKELAELLFNSIILEAMQAINFEIVDVFGTLFHFLNLDSFKVSVVFPKRRIGYMCKLEIVIIILSH